MKIFHIFLIIAFTIPVSFGAQISEINFLDQGFIEIFSNQTLNFTHTTISDENLGYENLSLIKNKNSSISIIVGTDFLSHNNISSLNCSVYSTGLFGPGKFGLKNSGENITITFENQTLNFTKNKNFNFQPNQSLNFNFYNDSYFISNKTPCQLNDFFLKANFSNSSFFSQNSSNQTLNITPILNNTQNISQIPPTNFTSSQNLTHLCKIDFQIIPQKNITTTRIRFAFIANVSNYMITYWVEDFENKTVKEKFNTTNKNSKQFTPKDYTQIYRIKAELHSGNCTINDSKKVIFYSYSNSYLKSQIEKALSVNLSKHKTVNSSKISVKSQIHNKTSYLKILNKKEIIDNKNDFIKYSAYKGDTLKRSLYFNLNGKKIFSFQLKKYQNRSGIIYFNKTFGLNSIKIFGIGLNQEFNFTYENNSKNISSKKFQFSKTNLSDINNNSIAKNISKKTNEIKKIANSNVHFRPQFYLKLDSNHSSKILFNVSKIRLKNQSEVFVSSNQQYKKNSFFPILFGVSTMLSTLVFLW